jgi:hypothetical protein
MILYRSDLLAPLTEYVCPLAEVPQVIHFATNYASDEYNTDVDDTDRGRHVQSNVTIRIRAITITD